MEIVATVCIGVLIGALAYVRLQKADKRIGILDARFAERSTRNAHNNIEYHNQHLQQQYVEDDTATSNSMWFE